MCQHVFLFRCGLKSREYIKEMIGKENTQKIMQLPLYHFLHYSVETEESHVYVLKLGARPRLESKGTGTAKPSEESGGIERG